MSGHAVGTKVRVTKDHAVGWSAPWPREGDVVTVTAHHPMPHAYGPKLDIYLGVNEAGEKMTLGGDYIEPYTPVIPAGTLVFVTETHDAGDGDTVYAGARLEIKQYYAPFYVARNTETGCLVMVLGSKIAPVEYERLVPPLPPALAGYDGQKFYHVSASDLGGYWEYSTYWGWSNFVADFPQRYMKQEVGRNLWSVGVLAEK